MARNGGELPHRLGTFALHVYWSARRHTDPAHQWLRRLVLETATAFARAEPTGPRRNEVPPDVNRCGRACEAPGRQHLQPRFNFGRKGWRATQDLGTPVKGPRLEGLEPVTFPTSTNLGTRQLRTQLHGPGMSHHDARPSKAPDPRTRSPHLSNSWTASTTHDGSLSPFESSLISIWAWVRSATFTTGRQLLSADVAVVDGPAPPSFLAEAIRNVSAAAAHWPSIICWTPSIHEPRRLQQALLKTTGEVLLGHVSDFGVSGSACPR